ncbi:GntR family transcriptional regulator [Roseibium sediminis]|uniref:GntR family transcriptional regulator n=1 Tax=Roseibium sediminis TaxID=1775174 RepID=UPI001375973D|nr:GntR family transcriptional regulator [Roseibium sediminis]
MEDPVSVFVKDSLSRSTDRKPLYRKITEALTEAMKLDVAGPSQPLPSERSLSAYLGVSRVTVRRALDDLASNGLLKRRQGARSSVGVRVEKTLSTLRGFSDELRARGGAPGQKWLQKQLAIPIPGESMALGLPPHEQIVRLVRIRLADGVPIALERAAVPRRFLPDPDLVTDSLYQALHKQDASPVRGVQRIRAGVATKAEADALEVDPGSPLLIVERRCFLANGMAVEFTETRYNGEMYDFISELQVQVDHTSEVGVDNWY